jgi:hypothetical protein
MSGLHPGDPNFEFEYGIGWWEAYPAVDPDDPFSLLSTVGMNTWGTFLEVGGRDTYIVGRYGNVNNTVWDFGADVLD